MTVVAMERQTTRSLDVRGGPPHTTQFAAGQFDLVGAGIVDLRPYLFGRALVRSVALLGIAVVIAVILFVLDLRSAFAVAAEGVVFLAAVCGLNASRYLLSGPNGSPRGARIR